MTWPSVTIYHTIVTLWQSHVILSHAPSCSCKSNKKRKEKKRKRNINNDLAILPSHNTTPLLSFLILRNFSTTRSIGLPYCPFRLHLPLSILELPNFLSQFLPSPKSSSLSLFLLVSCPSIISNFFLISSNIPGHIACLTIYITSLLWTSLVILHAWILFSCVLVVPHLPCLIDIPSQILQLPSLHSSNSLFPPKYQTLL